MRRSPPGRVPGWHSATHSNTPASSRIPAQETGRRAEIPAAHACDTQQDRNPFHCMATELTASMAMRAKQYLAAWRAAEPRRRPCRPYATASCSLSAHGRRDILGVVSNITDLLEQIKRPNEKKLAVGACCYCARRIRNALHRRHRQYCFGPRACGQGAACSLQWAADDEKQSADKASTGAATARRLVGGCGCVVLGSCSSSAGVGTAAGGRAPAEEAPASLTVLSTSGEACLQLLLLLLLEGVERRGGC